jgi:hypothetical protein
MTVGVTVFVDVDAGPGTGLHEDSNIGIFRHAVVGFAILTVDRPAAVGALLNDRRWADREAALVKNLLIPACVDFSLSPRADAGDLGVLQVGIDIQARRAFTGRPKPATVNLVLKEMPLSAVIEIDGSFV